MIISLNDTFFNDFNILMNQNWSNVNVITGNMYGKNEFESAQGEYRSFELSSCKL